MCFSYKYAIKTIADSTLQIHTAHEYNPCVLYILLVRNWNGTYMYSKNQCLQDYIKTGS